jgi:hypothetical protein
MVVQLYPQALGSLSSPPTTRRRYSNPTPRGLHTLCPFRHATPPHQWKYCRERCFLCGPRHSLRHPTTEELLEAVFSVRSVPRLYNEDQRDKPVREIHKAFQVPCIYDFIMKLCRQQAEVIQNHENANVRDIGKGEARHRKYKKLKLGGGQAHDRSSV